MMRWVRRYSDLLSSSHNPSQIYYSNDKEQRKNVYIVIYGTLLFRKHIHYENGTTPFRASSPWSFMISYALT